MDLTSVNGIRKSLVDQAVRKFPQFKDHRVPQRTVVHTAVKDICNLGSCITNGAICKDMEKIFSKEKAASSEDNSAVQVEQLQALLQSVLDVTNRISELEKTVSTLQTENLLLKEKLDMTEKTDPDFS